MSQIHFFEGPEKKLEIILKPEAGDLLSQPRRFWDELVDLAAAKILSSIETKTCKAFLLSESSLFVWSDRIILITCGTTTLINAAKHLAAVFGVDAFEEVFYERKNEYQPSLQKTSALDDMSCLKEILGGRVLRFGRKDDHHVYIYNNYFGAHKTEVKVNTLEILMYGLQGEFKDCCNKNTKAQEKALTSLKNILPQFKLDPFFFEPEGFSFNGLNQSQYATMHVTPQGSENYLSFEMDCINLKDADSIVKAFVELCKPISYDVIFFSTEGDRFEKNQDDEGLYKLKQFSKTKTESGYNVSYSHYYDKDKVNTEPFVI